jgi:hypothetical protein
MKRYLVAPLTVMVLGAAGQGWAHHSFAATYLENQTVTIEGELVQFVLRNPHSFVDVDVTEKDGSKTRYVVEWAAPAQLAGKVDRETLKPGDHFNVTTGSDTALTGQTNQRPNFVANVNPYKKSGNQWLNPAAFSNPAPGTYGNVPINGFVGPGAFNVDMGITRSFRTGGTREVQVRAELFNVFNTVLKSDPVATLNSPNFGLITAAGDPRIVQLAVKYVF